MSIQRSAYVGLVSLLTLAGCGTKPDGTPYGVNPSKQPDGSVRTGAPANSYGTGTGMPKGAEMNAVTSGARAGTPVQMPQDMPAR